MDPDANLAEQLKLADKLTNNECESVEAELDDMLRLAELVLTMNVWLSSGGFKPKAWS